MITVGSADNMTHPDDCKALYEKATPPKKWALIDGADHEFNEHRLILQEKYWSGYESTYKMVIDSISRG